MAASRRLILATLCVLLSAPGSASLAAPGEPGSTPIAAPGELGRESGPAGPAALAEHVVLVSIDGLLPAYYRDTAWPAPMIQRMAQQGAWAEGVRGVFPSVTYPSHTTMITGALPARHGVFYNSPFEPGGQTGRWYWEEEAIRVPTLWDAVRQAGGTTVSISWPVSVGAPVDWNLPEIWPLDGSDPIDAVRNVTTPPELFAEIEREATGRLTRHNFTIDHVTREDRAGAAAAYLLEQYRPTLLTVHLIAVDHFTHEEGTDGPTVPLAVAAVDRAVAAMVEASERAGLSDSTAFVVTGDHGFVDTHSALAPNVWLAEAGLLEERPDRGDWRASFHSSAASAFLQLRDPDDDAALRQVKEILESAPPRLRRLYRIVEEDELRARGANPSVRLALDPAPGITITSAASGPLLRPDVGATHGYYPDFPAIRTGLVAWGAGVRAGTVVPQMGLEDVAPLVAALLGLPFDAPDGTLLPGLLREAPEVH